MAPSKKGIGKKAISSSKKKPTADRPLSVQNTEVCGSQEPLASRLESESRPSSNGAEENSKADEFKYLLNYQVFLDEVVIKKDGGRNSAESENATRKYNRGSSMLWWRTKATNLVECMIADSREYYEFEEIIETWNSEKRSGMRVDLSLRYTKDMSRKYLEDSDDVEDAQSQFIKKKRKTATSVLLEAANKRRHQEELDSTELSYKRQILETHRCCVKTCPNNGNTCFVRGLRHFPISAKHLNDWNESIKIGHATIYSLPSSIDLLPAKGTSNPGYADHSLAHPTSPAPYPQLPPQYWYQNLPYTPPPASYYYSFLPPNHSPIPVSAQNAHPTSISSATAATASNLMTSQSTSTDSDPSDIFDEYIEWYAQKSKGVALEIRLAGSVLRRKGYEGLKSISETGWQSLDIEAGIAQRLLSNFLLSLQ
ncbi:hypothetical protein V1517DRAFT_376086 [Lipomyces orientalis]|uniref:Uncharacterized protein n=1 Tax=Lipomyces orientalis TaxID=1233043 RepID=A0ACC3TFL0_9ASCO